MAMALASSRSSMDDTSVMVQVLEQLLRSSSMIKLLVAVETLLLLSEVTLLSLSSANRSCGINSGLFWPGIQHETLVPLEESSSLMLRFSMSL
jgi:hypothetical protein